MVKNMIKQIVMSLFQTILVLVISFWGFEIALNAMFNYSSVEASYHLLTHSLLIGLIYTVILCTTLILDRLEK